jgi:hypothetical protein
MSADVSPLERNSGDRHQFRRRVSRRGTAHDVREGNPDGAPSGAHGHTWSPMRAYGDARRPKMVEKVSRRFFLGDVLKFETYLLP